MRSLAELGAASLEPLELLGGVVVLDHRHRLQGVQELVGRRLVVFDGAEEPCEPEPEGLERRELLCDAVQVAAHRGGDAVAGVQQRSDLLERKPDIAQRPQPVQPPNVGRGVEPVPGLRSLGRHEQPEAVVVVQGPDRDARRPCQVADLEVRSGHQHACDARPSRYVRFKRLGAFELRAPCGRPPRASATGPAACRRAAARPARAQRPGA